MLIVWVANYPNMLFEVSPCCLRLYVQADDRLQDVSESLIGFLRLEQLEYSDLELHG